MLALQLYLCVMAYTKCQLTLLDHQEGGGGPWVLVNHLCVGLFGIGPVWSDQLWESSLRNVCTLQHSCNDWIAAAFFLDINSQNNNFDDTANWFHIMRIKFNDGHTRIYVRNHLI